MTVLHSRFIGREQGSRVIALALLTAAWIILAWPWLSGRVTIPWDAKAQFLPQLQFLAASFAKGESPFWTPYVFSGLPQIADPQSLIFSPPYLLLAAFDPAPTAWAADATLYGLLLVSAAAMFLWLTDKGWHGAAALLSAIAFAFGAAMAWRVQHIGQVMSLAYLPIALLLLDRALVRRSIAYGAAAGFSAALLVLGRDQVALMSVYFLIAYVAANLFSGSNRTEAIVNALRPLAVAAIAGIVVIALPVLMTALVAAESNRPSIDFVGAGRGSLHPAHLLSFFAPDVFGATGHYGEYWGPPSGLWKNTDLYLAQNMGQMYIGAMPALLLVWGAITGVLWRPGARIFTGALVVSVIYGLGWYTPVFKFIHAVVPGVDLYRRPADAVFVIGFFASVVAGFTLNTLLSEPVPQLANWQKAALVAFPVTVFATMASLAQHFGKLGDDWPAIAIPAAATCAAAAFLYVVVRDPMRAIPVAAAIALFQTADLAYSNIPGGATGLPPSTYEVLDPATSNSTIALLKKKTAEAVTETRRDRVEIVGFGFHWPNASLTHDLENTLGYNPLRLGRYSRATGAGDQSGLPEQKEFSPLFPSYRSRLADLLGLRFIATSVPIEQIDKNLQSGDLTLTAKTADGFVYENPRALPRVMFATSSVADDFERMIESGTWPNVDPATTVVLETPARPPAHSAGKVRIAEYHNTKVVIEADSAEGGYVVLNDIWQPWWFASIDDQDAPILRANVLFRAVDVPPGRHRIVFSFEPLRGVFAQLRHPAAK